MAYIPSTLTIAEWSVPLTISGADSISQLDDTVNAIMDTNGSSVKAHINAELAKLPSYLSTELIALYNDLGEQINVIAGLSATAAELNVLDGITASTSELNILDGVTSTTAELNILDGVTATALEINTLDGITSTTEELNIMDGVTATTAELNIMDGVTSTAAELNKVDGYTGDATELNYAKALYDTGVTDTEFNYLDGVTSDIQTQFGLKAPLADPTFTGTVTLPVDTVVDIVADTTPQLGGDLEFNGKTANESAVRQIADASLGTGTHTFDYANGDMQQLTATGSITLALSNFPTGDVSGFIIDVINFGAYTITHPSGMLFQDGAAPDYTTSGTDRIMVMSDKDAVLTLVVVGYDIKV